MLRSVQTIAFNLPNDERVRKEKGAKKVMLRNLIAAKFKTILKPIATTLMKKKQLPLLSQAEFLLKSPFLKVAKFVFFSSPRRLF